MDAFLAQMVGWAGTSLMGAIVGGLVAQVRHKTAKDKALERGMRALMRAQLIELHEQYVAEDRPCPVGVKEQATSIYHAYHDLGGNGTGTRLYEEIMAAHVK